jgi:hypothetical protein
VILPNPLVLRNFRFDGRGILIEGESEQVAHGLLERRLRDVLGCEVPDHDDLGLLASRGVKEEYHAAKNSSSSVNLSSGHDEKPL